MGRRISSISYENGYEDGFENAKKKFERLAADRQGIINEQAIRITELEKGIIMVAPDGSKRNAYDLVDKISRLESALKEVSGCHNNHDTPKLCDGCLAAISHALAE